MLILNYSWAVWLAWLLGAFFALNGIAGLAGIDAAWNALLPWGSRLWRRLAGTSCLVIGLMIAWYPSRPFGLLLGILLCVAACAALMRRRDFARLPRPVILAAVILATAWGLRLI